MLVKLLIFKKQASKYKSTSSLGVAKHFDLYPWDQHQLSIDGFIFALHSHTLVRRFYGSLLQHNLSKLLGKTRADSETKQKQITKSTSQ